MNKLSINELLIFDPANKLCKEVNFTDGINVLTSDEENGNDVGKSIIMKSIFHTLGADCYFDNKWNLSSKVFYLRFNLNSVNYSMYRHHNLFRLYDEELNVLFYTLNRAELAKYLEQLFEFSVYLPNRGEDELVLTPPAYSYLLNYVDQDYMHGTKFDSFTSLAQFKSYKENLIYNHFGIFNEEFFRIIRDIENLKRDLDNLDKNKDLTKRMIVKLNSYLNGFSAPTDFKALEKEVENYSIDYIEIVGVLEKLKNKLIDLRNSKYEINESIDTIRNTHNIDLKTITMLKTDKCPTCSKEIERSDIVLTKSNRMEDLFLVKENLNELLLETERKIQLIESEYKVLIDKKTSFLEIMNRSNNEISGVLKHLGYTESKDNLLSELVKIDADIITKQNQYDSDKKKLGEFNSIKKKANNLYASFLNKYKGYFGVEEIDSKKFENIRHTFTAGGSNKPIATIMWYVAIQNVKYSFNQNVIRFPIVIDSPNNVESDLTKKFKLLNFIFNEYDKKSQLILSTLGFKPEDHSNSSIDNVIHLKNDKYKLLNEDDYDKNRAVLKQIFED